MPEKTNEELTPAYLMHARGDNRIMRYAGAEPVELFNTDADSQQVIMLLSTMHNERLDVLIHIKRALAADDLNIIRTFVEELYDKEFWDALPASFRDLR